MGYDVGGGPIGDQYPPRAGGGAAPIWSADGSTILDKVCREGRANLQKFDPEAGTASPLTEGDRNVISFSASADRSKLAILMSTAMTMGDIYLLNVDTRDMKQLTAFNQSLFAELNLSEPEEIWYTSFDGKKIHAWIQKPPHMEPGKKYPLILNIHGGPHAAYGHTFFHEFHMMAARGYVVLYPNPRGSSSYGEEFGNIIQYAYPGDDYKDLMAGVDEVVKRGYVDDKRMAVTGGSGGGLLTNWVITQTDRFAAAASQRSIADWGAWWYAVDFTLFHPNWFKKAPFEDPADYERRSPITYVDRIKTPLMLIEGEADFRTPSSSGGEIMFRALKFLKKPVVMVRFPGESHELSRSGKPWHRVERLAHIVNWFDKYLQAKPMPQYDPPKEEKAPVKAGQ
jgi:dipeptidyl aminopeptidase/acylaminoacyl peptidase